MRHARADYDRIQDPAGLIPQEEPVFLIRGQDVCGPATVRSWAKQARLYGASYDIVKAAMDQANLMEVWQNHGGSKIPDMPEADLREVRAKYP